MPNYSKLIKKLALLYPTIPQSQVILKYTNIDTSNIAFSAAATENWLNIINYIEPRNKLDIVIQTIIDDSDLDHSELIQFVKEETKITPYQDVSKALKEAEPSEELDEIKKNLKRLVSRGRVKEVLNKLAAISEDFESDDYTNSITLLQAQLNGLKNREIQGILSREELTIGENRIRNSVIYQIDELESEYEIEELLNGIIRTEPTINVPAKLEYERIIGNRNNIHPIEWLTDAVERSKFVGKIEIAGNGSGTGFLVKGGYVMTNHHVLCSLRDLNLCEMDCQQNLVCPKRLRLRMGYDRRSNGVLYDLDPQNGYYANKELDYALIKVKDNSNIRLADWGCAEFDSFNIPQKDDLVNIIQHPEGEMKKIALPDKVISVWEDKKSLYYIADTKRGSSGSPVFNQDWKVIGLHHAGKNWGGGMEINAQGEMQDTNKGILVKYILEELSQKGISV